MPSEKQQDFELFFRELLPNELEGDELLSLVFFGSSKKPILQRASHWKGAVDAVEKLGPKNNCFVGVSTIHDKATGRGSEKDTVSCLSFVLDMDIANEKRGSGKDYFDSEDQALSLVQALPVTPTFTINSGGGLHAWYMFREPWTFVSESERTAAKSLSRRFWATANQIAAQSGKVLDSTFDLSRIMRVPGTKNFKYGLESFTVEHSGVRHDPEDFLDWTLPIEECGVDVSGGTASFDMRKIGKGVPENWELLAAADPGLQDLVFHRRKLGGRDQSLSSYDLGIASKLKHAGVDDQTCVAIMVWHRKIHRGKLKPPSYYKRTMVRVNATVGSPVTGVVSHTEARRKAAGPTAIPDTVGENQWERQYGFDLKRIEMFKNDEGGEEYLIYVQGEGSLFVRPVSSSDILMRASFWKKVWLIAGTSDLCKLTGKTWDAIFLPLIKKAITPAEYDNPVGVRLPRYLASVVIGTELDTDELYAHVREGGPFVYKDQLWVNHTHLSDFISKNGKPIPSSSLSMWLGKIGFERDTLTLIMSDDSTRDLTLWRKDDLQSNKIFDVVLAMIKVDFGEYSSDKPN